MHILAICTHMYVHNALSRSSAPRRIAPHRHAATALHTHTVHAACTLRAAAAALASFASLPQVLHLAFSRSHISDRRTTKPQRTIVQKHKPNHQAKLSSATIIIIVIITYLHSVVNARSHTELTHTTRDPHILIYILYSSTVRRARTT